METKKIAFFSFNFYNYRFCFRNKIGKNTDDSSETAQGYANFIALFHSQQKKTNEKNTFFFTCESLDLSSTYAAHACEKFSSTHSIVLLQCVRACTCVIREWQSERVRKRAPSMLRSRTRFSWAWPLRKLPLAAFVLVRWLSNCVPVCVRAFARSECANVGASTCLAANVKNWVGEWRACVRLCVRHHSCLRTCTLLPSNRYHASMCEHVFWFVCVQWQHWSLPPCELMWNVDAELARGREQRIPLATSFIAVYCQPDSCVCVALLYEWQV